MPVKRRRDKSRSLDSSNLEDQFYGPGTCLFNGEGYLGEYGSPDWSDAHDDTRAAVLEAMREDWIRFEGPILAAWDGRSEHELWCAKRHHLDPKLPWAQTKFGEQEQ